MKSLLWIKIAFTMCRLLKMSKKEILIFMTYYVVENIFIKSSWYLQKNYFRFILHLTHNGLFCLRKGKRKKCNRKKKSILLYMLTVKWGNGTKCTVERFKELMVSRLSFLFKKRFEGNQHYHKQLNNQSRICRQLTRYRSLHYLIYVQGAEFWVQVISDSYITEISPQSHFLRFLCFSLKIWILKWIHFCHVKWKEKSMVTWLLKC